MERRHPGRGNSRHVVLPPQPTFSGAGAGDGSSHSPELVDANLRLSADMAREFAGACRCSIRLIDAKAQQL
jgi:hypothetical protein